MEYMGNNKWWDERFKSHNFKIMLHEKCLENDLKFFNKNGKILDIACGDGRNAIYLAQLGYKVTAIDFSKEALNRLNYFANKESLKIETLLSDLSLDNSFDNLGKFDGAIINHYRLKPQLYDKVMEHLTEDGILWINGFVSLPADNPNITEKDIFNMKDFLSLKKYKLESKKIYKINQNQFIRYIMEKIKKLRYKS